jgi:outer-membrane receptor for ferric coprogen and ferric-rhodotorulic acid
MMKHPTGSARRRSRFLSFTALVMVAGMGTLASGSAMAQDAAPERARTYEFNLPAQPLARSVTTVATQTGLQVLYGDVETATLRAPAISGRMTAEEALSRLLAGSGYTFRYSQPGVITVERAAPKSSDGERVLGAVRVEGAQGSPYFGGAGQAAGVNGVNGSRDITATEGTGSFTSGALTIGSKYPQAMKDVPQSVSVLTSERLTQQNITNFDDAMRQLPGVSFEQTSNPFKTNFYSRGYLITTMQVDGGAPMVGGGANNSFQPVLDMSIFDHVELLRGSNGLFTGYGDPGGTINLVRKKPLDHNQLILEAQVGSWRDYRGMADVAGPLALDGALRGRLVLTYQNEHFFYDIAKNERKLIYGVVDWDVASNTLVELGGSYQKQNGIPFWGGLPRYLTGEDLNLPRSACLCFTWNRSRIETKEAFVQIEQKLGSDWSFKINGTRRWQDSGWKIGISDGGIYPDSKTGANFRGDLSEFSASQSVVDFSGAGAVHIFGQRQEVTFGVSQNIGNGKNYFHLPLFNTDLGPIRGGDGNIYCTDAFPNCPDGSIPTQLPVNVFDAGSRATWFPEPADTLLQYSLPVRRSRAVTAYLNLRLTAFDRLHLNTGVRWSYASSRTVTQFHCTAIPTTGSCAGRNLGDVYFRRENSTENRDFSWPPTVNISFDINKDMTAYVGYNDIYISQSNYLRSDGSPMEPVTGASYEFGFKWAPNGGRINLSAAAFLSRQRDFVMFDNEYGQYTDYGDNKSCCWVTDPNATQEAKGFDLEATGELLRGWQIAVSYTYSENKSKGSSYGSSAGKPFITIAPAQLYKLWTTVNLGAIGLKGWARNMSTSIGINGQSHAFYSGSVCVKFNDPDPVTGSASCRTYSPPDFIPFSFTVPAYAVVSGRIDYKFNDNLSASLNLINLLDKRYYETVGSFPTDGNWYASPRAFKLSVQAKF